MDLYETDANTLLAIENTPDSLESKLNRLPVDKQKYLKDTFNYMISKYIEFGKAHFPRVCKDIQELA